MVAFAEGVSESELESELESESDDEDLDGLVFGDLALGDLTGLDFSTSDESELESLESSDEAANNVKEVKYGTE